MSDPYERIIWSADVPDVPTLLEWLDQLLQLRYVKIDRAFVDANGWGVFAELEDRAVKVFDDAKIIEIPVKLAQVARVHCKKARPWMLNCMAGGVSNYVYGTPAKELDGLKRFADTCHEFDVVSCAVSVLTSKSEEVVLGEFNRTPNDQVFYYAEQLVQAGFDSMVCAPPEAKLLRQEHEFDSLQLVTPGVRPAGAATGDQSRVATPASTIKNGADYLVIGRPITNGQGTPAENLAAIAEEIAAVP